MPRVCFPNWRSMKAAENLGRKIGRRARRHFHKHPVAVGVTCVWIPPAIIGPIWFGPWSSQSISNWQQGAAPSVSGSLGGIGGSLVSSNLPQGAATLPEPSSVAIFAVAVLGLFILQAMRRRRK